MDKKKSGKKKLDFSVGNVSGPVQISYGETIHPIEIWSDTSTRCCLTNPNDADKEGDVKGAKSTSGQMYPNHLIRFGLYFVPGRIVPEKAKRTGFSSDDAEVMFKALAGFAMHDHSKSRKLSVEAVYAFELSDDAFVKDSVLEDLIRDNIVLDSATPRSMKEVHIPPLDWVRSKVERIGLSRVVNVREIVSELHQPIDLAAGGSYAEFLKGNSNVKKAMAQAAPAKREQSDGVKRTVFITLISGANTNPNGDPESENMPRVDVKPDGFTYGITTDVMLKRKIRDEVFRMFNGKAPYDIFVQKGVPLVTKQKEALLVGGDGAVKADGQKYMLQRYFDARAFGMFGAAGKEEVDEEEEEEEAA